jgi:hypothetical protein
MTASAEPWSARRDWVAKRMTSSRSIPSGIAILVFFGSLTVFLGAWLFQAASSGQWVGVVGMLILIFAFGVMTLAGLFTLLDAFRFGVVELELDEVPVLYGSVLRGRVRVPRGVVGQPRAKLVLELFMTERTRQGERLVGEQRLQQEAPVEVVDGAAIVPIEIALPPEGPEPVLGVFAPRTAWKLSVSVVARRWAVGGRFMPLPIFMPRSIDP